MLVLQRNYNLRKALAGGLGSEPAAAALSGSLEQADLADCMDEDPAGPSGYGSGDDVGEDDVDMEAAGKQVGKICGPAAL
jgi:hypothetical protein